MKSILQKKKNQEIVINRIKSLNKYRLAFSQTQQSPSSGGFTKYKLKSSGN